MENNDWEKSIRLSVLAEIVLNEIMKRLQHLFTDHCIYNVT